jgi:hypothetical protein
MTDTFDLSDADIDLDDIEPDEYYIEIRAISSDGTSDDFVVDDPNDLQTFLTDLKADQDADRLSKLTAQQRERYDRFASESECRCDGSCSEICWFDLQDRDQWLNEVAPTGIDIEWVWMLGDDIRGPEGSGFLTEFNTVIDEGPGLARDIWRQVDWD